MLRSCYPQVSQGRRAEAVGSLAWLASAGEGIRETGLLELETVNTKLPKSYIPWVRSYVPVYTYIYIYTNSFICIYTYIHLYIYQYIYIYILMICVIYHDISDYININMLYRYYVDVVCCCYIMSYAFTLGVCWWSLVQQTIHVDFPSYYWDPILSWSS